MRGSYSCKCNSAYIGDGFDCYYSYARGKSCYFAMLMLTLFSLATSTLLILAGTLSFRHIYRHYLFFVCLFVCLVGRFVSGSDVIWQKASRHLLWIKINFRSKNDFKLV